MQHKKEAWWFYRFLSIFYDKYVNPLFWTEQMRDQSLQLAQLNDPALRVIDVGSGTGFTTQGIVRHVKADHVVCVDQSPHQMAKAKAKEDLKDCIFEIGDAEQIPFKTDLFDRYVSAGSIEYWPDPLQGIREAYRVIKPGGVAMLVGPLEPGNRISRFIAETWMLFPKDREYREWFKTAGFTDIRVEYVRPQWYKGKGEYGLAIAGVKPEAGASPSATAVPDEKATEKMTLGRALKLAWRVLIGSLAGFLFIPIALAGYLQNIFSSKADIPPQYRERLNRHQIVALIVIAAVVGLLLWLIL